LFGVLAAVSFANAADENTTALDGANQLYDSGNCDKAVPMYQEIRKQANISADQKDIATFRIGYCAYSDGDFKTALTEFGAVIAAHPDEDEARLHYAESLQATQQYHESVVHALKVHDEDLYVSARLVAAQSLIEMQQAQKAITALKDASGKDTSLDPVVDFWRGMAYFQMFDEQAAETAFKRSYTSSNDKLWTRSASENWLKTLAESKSWVHFRAGATYGYDSDLTQLTYQDAPMAPPNSGYYIGDSFTAYDLSLSTKTFHSDRVTLSPSISTYGLYYSNPTNKAYNPTTYTANLAATYMANYRWTHRLSLSYTDSLYNNNHYLDYLAANYAAIYGISKNATAHAGLSVTHAVGDYPGWTYAPTIGAEGDMQPFYWLANVTYTQVTGDKAVYVNSGGSESVSTGSTFSNYTSETYRAGLGSVLPGDFDLLAEVTWTDTTFATETVPQSAAFALGQRKDHALSLQAVLSRSLIERRMTLNASSQGYQGLVYTSEGISPSYTYVRSLASLYLSYGF
jgi:predicted negative regulator of RcsB-dependent stress response